MTVHGTVEHGTLTIERQDGTITNARFHSWAAATDAYRHAVSTNPSAAIVHAVQRRTGQKIKTWDYALESH